MGDQRLSHARYRTLLYGIACFGLICLAAAFTVPGVGDTRGHEILLLLVAVACGVSLVLARMAYARGDRAMLERIALCLIAAAGLMLAEAVAWTFVSPLLQAGHSAFRLHFAFLPLYYLGAVALLPMRMALRLAWWFWAVMLVVTVAGLYFRTGMNLQHDGVAELLIWMAFGNPLVLLLLHALPKYEEALDRSATEVADLRQRVDLNEKLAESERRFNLVAEGMQVGVWDRWVYPDTRRWWSPRFYELIGYAPDELEPSEENLKALMHPDERDRVWEEGTRQLAQGDIMDLEFRLNTKHRGYRWFNSHAKAQRDADGKLVRLAGAIEDIHDRRTAEQALHMTQAELTRMAYRDTLTDLHNRRYFDEHFKREWERARRSRQPLTLMLVDLDYFKAYNDRYGHPAGDLCLVEVAHLLNRATSRATDILARLGGEEFGIVLPETNTAGAEEVAERIRQLLRLAAIPNEGSKDKDKVLTLSIGYAVLDTADGPSANELYEQADRALYEVKRRGRNGVLKFWGRANLSAVPKDSA